MNNIRIKDVDLDISWLLGRNPVPPKTDLMGKNITDKVVMVTGAGGSIGSEICRQVVSMKPKALVLYEMSEFALYTIQVELNRIAPDIKVVAILGSVRNYNRVFRTINKYQVQTIYHAAAYKHVPMVEYNISEGVINNVEGTVAVADAAYNLGVETFVLVSTDKAVRPTNIMGASKRLAEMYLQALNSMSSCTRFCMVRFGNVLGSSGSVVPLFIEQIASNHPLTITNVNMTRYFMSIPEASQLVIQAGAMADGGEVFVLDMGEPIRIVDIARRLLLNAGIHFDNFVVTGLRPGEKLYEELLIGDNVTKTSHEKIMKANEEYLPYNKISRIIDDILIHCGDEEDYPELIDLLVETVSGFTHSGEIKDQLY